MNKRSELANILRRLADYVDSRSDDELAPLFQQAANLLRTAEPQRKLSNRLPHQGGSREIKELAAQLQTLRSREDGELLLQERVTNKITLESLARFLQLPVQRDDTVERLRAKIVENTVGSRLRSDAIQGKDRFRRNTP